MQMGSLPVGGIKNHVILNRLPAHADGKSASELNWLLAHGDGKWD